MEAQAAHPAEEIKRLQRCISDLISVLALPAIWAGGEPSHVAGTLLDSLLSMLRLDLIYIRLHGPVGEAPIEILRTAHTLKLTIEPQEFGNMLVHWLGDDPRKWPQLFQKDIGGGSISLAPLRLGLHSEIGVIVTGSRRVGFPEQTEKLILGVAANQASIGLQEARLLSEQKRVAIELDQRVAQRTRELAEANEELRKEIDERKLTEEKLRLNEADLLEAHTQVARSEERWRSVFENSAIGVALTDLNGRFFATNPVYQEMLGYTEEELQNLSFLDITHEEDRNPNLELVGELLAGKCRQFQLEKQYLRKDGKFVWVRNHVSIVQGTERMPRFLMAIVEDVSDRKLAEEALDKVRAELSHVTRVMSLGTMTASIAHEVNQPLSGIITNASTALRMLASDPPNVDGACETARRTIRDANRAAEVITRLRALYSKKEPAFESVNLNEAAREVIGLLANELQRNRLVLRVDLADDLPSVTGDRIQLQQVILNLLRNASDAMSTVDDRPRHLMIKTERDNDDCVRLTVQDSGIGFAPQAMGRLFDAFYTSKNDGMGMGLSVSHSIIESHHGRLWAALNDGPGATFCFSIPWRLEDMKTGFRA